MANKKVSELTAATEVDEASDVLPFLDDSASELKNITPTLLLALYAKIASPTFTGIVTTPTVKLTTGAVVDYIWKCNNANGSGAWAEEAAPSSQVLPANHISGLALSHAADTAHDITVAIGKARDATDAADMVLASAITKAFDAEWAVGTGQGGFAAGESLPASGTIHIWLIKRSDTGVVDVFANNNATTGLAPTLPTNYDYKRRIGSYRTDSSNNILNGSWYGTGTNRKFTLSVSATDYNGNPVGTSAISYALSVPNGIQVSAIFNAIATNAATYFALFTSLDSTDSTPSATNYNLTGLGANYGPSLHEIMTNTSGQVRFRTSTEATVLLIMTRGWWDFL